MIPKILVYGWFGNNPKPKKIQRCIDSWKKNAPEYQIIELNESNWDIESSRYAKKAYEEEKWAFVWDEARIRWLQSNAGCTVDADIEILKPFDPFLHHVGFTSKESSGKWISAVIGAESNTYWMNKIHSYYDKTDFLYDPENITNTVVIDSINRKLFEKQRENVVYLKGGIAIYPRDYFEAKDWSTGQINITPRTHSIHHYKGSWVT